MKSIVFNGRNILLTGNIGVDMTRFQDACIEVGYQNHKANQKDDNGNYDNDEIEKYERMRNEQLDFYELMVKHYEKT